MQASAVGQPYIISRAQWGANESWRAYAPGCNGTPSYADNVHFIVVHHTDTGNNYGPADSAAAIRGIYYFHTHTNLWCDIGYNFIIDQYGQIFEGRYGGIAQAVIGAHAGGFNTGSSGIALLGTFSSVGMSPAMYSALRSLVTWEVELHHINPLGYVTAVAGSFAGARWPAGTVVALPTIIGHRDVDFTDCPGAGVYVGLPGVRADVAAGLPPLSPYTLAINQHWLALGGPNSPDGIPTTSQLFTPGGIGQYEHFQYGSIYWTAQTGAWEVQGFIRLHWAALGWELSVLGYPITDERLTSDGVGRYNNFQNGSIYWTPQTGAWEIQGHIRQHWIALGGVSSVVGYPTSNESGLPDGIGRYNTFQRGNLYWSPATGAFEVHGPILRAYLSVRATQSALGYPTSDVFSTSSGVRAIFQGGYIDWLSATNQTVITYT
jgi:uncharacterized protein with LGFP repeats